MRKSVIAKGNIHPNDHARALVTDTLPGDVPIVVSNDGFYKNIKAIPHANGHYQEFIDRLLKRARPYTIPYRYNILRANGSPRKLSLMHPSGQMDVANFYREYGNLIAYFCRKSDASIRSPRKVGSLFFVRGRGSEKNKLKGEGIDTTNLEKTVSNPASYFAYAGYDRIYKFFNSTDYMRLEKKYAIMYFADISKCFNSLYTHTLFWATADVATAKDNTSAAGFSNAFDKLMQSVNYNETNGICVGAEVSRVFAELILSEVDKRSIEYLRKSGLDFKVNYEFRRYVDDYMIFADDDAVAQKVMSSIKIALGEFNLHLNDEKTVKVSRPFITVKSRIVQEANISLSNFFDKFIESGKSDEGSFLIPKRVWKSHALLRSLLDSVKAACFDREAGYQDVSNYIIGALSDRIEAIISGYDLSHAHPDVTEENFVSSLSLLLESAYFFYSVNPTVGSSLRIAQAAIRTFQFFIAHFPSRQAYLAEQIVRWTFQFIKGLRGVQKHVENDCVPLEAINLLLVLGEVGKSEAVAQNAVADFCDSRKDAMYFEIVSYLFCIKQEACYKEIRENLLSRARDLLTGKDRLRNEAHAAYLALDILSCPYLEQIQRASLFNDLRAAMDLPRLPQQEAQAAIANFEQFPWFVDWKEPNLLRMIRKKELSAVY